MALNVFLILVAYVLGSIPSAVWIGKRFYGIDVREHGSRNAGATNTLRVLGARAALPVFAIDILKGFAAVMLAHLSGYEAGSSQMFNLKIALVAAAVRGTFCRCLPISAEARESPRWPEPCWPYIRVPFCSAWSFSPSFSD